MRKRNAFIIEDEADVKTAKEVRFAFITENDDIAKHVHQCIVRNAINCIH